MPRRARVVIPGVAHHITQRGNNRQVVFEEKDDYLQYCHWINIYAAGNRVEVLAYCLMTNHVHFIVIPADEIGIGRLFNTAHMRYAQYMNKKRKTSGHLWQGRFYSCVMDDEHLYRAIRYIERNPVRNWMVKMAWEYAWSSAGLHVGIVAKSEIYLNDISTVNGTGWREYLEEQDEQFDGEIRLQTQQGFALGGVQFISKMESRVSRVLAALKAGRPRKRCVEGK